MSLELRLLVNFFVTKNIIYCSFVCQLRRASQFSHKLTLCATAGGTSTAGCPHLPPHLAAFSADAAQSSRPIDDDDSGKLEIKFSDLETN